MPAEAARRTSATPPQDGPADRRWMPVRQAAVALGLTAQHVRKICRTGGLVARQIRIGTRSVWQVDAACRPALAIAAGLGPAVALAGDPLAGVSAAKRDRAQTRLQIVDAYREALSRRPAGVDLAPWRRHWVDGWNLQHAASGGPSPKISIRSLQRWDRALRESGIAGLVDRRYNTEPAACTDAAWQFFAGMYLDQARPSVPALYEIVAAHAIAEEWNWPSLRTVRRWTLQRLDPKLAALGRDPKRYRDRCIPHVERDWTRVAANHLWVADHRQFDVFLPHLVKTGKGKLVWKWHCPWLTAFLDARTWKPVAWRIRFAAPNGNQVMETFAQGIEAHGQPVEVYFDNGKDFRMLRLAGGRKCPPRKGEKIVCEQYVKPMLDLLRIGSRWAIPYNAKAKTIESWFSIVSERFDKTWPSYRGNKAERKPERFKALSKRAEEYHAKGYTLEAFCQAFESWVKTDYELRESPASAAGGLSPARAFVELRPADYVPVRPPWTSLALLLMPSVPVRVEANGIYVRAFGRHYWSNALEDRRCGSGRDLKRKVRYRYREDDPSCIYVFDGQSDRFLCLATPYIGGGMNPLAEAGSEDAERLARAMALQRGKAKDGKKEVERLRKVATNRLLAAARESAETLNLLDDPAAIPAPAAPRLTLTETGIDAAGVAAATHQQRREATDAAKAGLHAAYAATGTDDAEPGSSACPSALEFLAGARAEKESPDERQTHTDRTPDTA